MKGSISLLAIFLFPLMGGKGIFYLSKTALYLP